MRDRGVRYGKLRRMDQDFMTLSCLLERGVLGKVLCMLVLGSMALATRFWPQALRFSVSELMASGAFGRYSQASTDISPSG